MPTRRCFRVSNQSRLSHFDTVSLTGKLQLSVKELQDLITQGTTLALIDVREPWEVELCRIPNSRSIPLADLPAHIGELATEVPLVMICHHGTRSLHATMWLRQNGFDNAINLSGGVDAWAREIDGNMARY